jgi:hypothetical protein
MLILATYMLMKVATGSEKLGAEGCAEEGEVAVDSRLAEDVAEDTNCTGAWMLMRSVGALVFRVGLGLDALNQFASSKCQRQVSALDLRYSDA